MTLGTLSCHSVWRARMVLELWPKPRLTAEANTKMALHLAVQVVGATVPPGTQSLPLSVLLISRQ